MSVNGLFMPAAANSASHLFMNPEPGYTAPHLSLSLSLSPSIHPCCRVPSIRPPSVRPGSTQLGFILFLCLLFPPLPFPPALSGCYRAAVPPTSYPRNAAASGSGHAGLLPQPLLLIPTLWPHLSRHLAKGGAFARPGLVVVHGRLAVTLWTWWLVPPPVPPLPPPCTLM